MVPNGLVAQIGTKVKDQRPLIEAQADSCHSRFLCATRTVSLRGHISWTTSNRAFLHGRDPSRSCPVHPRAPQAILKISLYTIVVYIQG
ncbi:hypothetical protein M408DRAFT_264562 [Serendipita vermifera MAFF 305830]|uniref:Uncharacterized protein n=1 Tax=Serendipita vermifera MAFF 305830 TaxID=933852 RepID=A0A0C3ATI7_SERVB|nr:hypothetical protein M408DRAFT_264562 [Serendipita vermifera MAFF 305830]